MDEILLALNIITTSPSCGKFTLERFSVSQVLVLGEICVVPVRLPVVPGRHGR